MSELQNFVHFFLSKSEDKNVNENKTKIIQQNIPMFACLSARVSDEKEFEEFLDTYNIDINLIEEQTILLLLFFIKLHH